MGAGGGSAITSWKTLLSDRGKLTEDVYIIMFTLCDQIRGKEKYCTSGAPEA